MGVVNHTCLLLPVKGWCTLFWKHRCAVPDAYTACVRYHAYHPFSVVDTKAKWLATDARHILCRCQSLSSFQATLCTSMQRQPSSSTWRKKSRRARLRLLSRFDSWLCCWTCVDIFAHHAKLNRPAVTWTLSMYYEIDQTAACMLCSLLNAHS